MRVALMLSTAIGLGTVFVEPAFAQTATPQPAPVAGVPTADEQSSLQDIVVMAQRRSQNLQDVPVAITAVSASQLQASSISNAQDLAAITPGLTATAAAGSFQPRIRGVGTNATGPGLENPIATYVDGVYIAGMPSSLFSFSDVERVEVLRGPQGTLFGRNATGGLIQIITRDPTNTVTGDAAVGYANYNTVTTSAYLAGPLADGIKASLAYRGAWQGDGYGTNLATGTAASRLKSDVSVRGKLVLDPASGTKIRISGDYSSSNGTNSAIREAPGEKSAVGAGVPGSRVWNTNNDFDQVANYRGGGGSIKIEQDVGFADLMSLTAYRKSTFTFGFDSDLSPTFANNVILRQADRQISQEINLSSKRGSSISWLVGGYYFNLRSKADPVTIQLGPILRDPAFPLSQIDIFGTQGSISWAGYAQATAPLGARTNLTIGLRYTTEKRTFDVRNDGTVSFPAPIGTVVLPLVPDTHREARFSKLTWRAALDHKFGDHLMGYVSYNRGFKSGGFNIQRANDPAYLPEVLDAYEAGVKADLFDRKLRLNPAFFYYDYKNIQVPIFDTGQIAIINGPKATLYGADLDFQAIATDALTLRGGVSVIHSRYGDFPGAQFLYPQAAGGSTLVIANAKGNRVTLTPDWTATIAADYKIDLPIGRMLLNTTYTHSDGYFTEASNLRRQGAYDLVSASATLTIKDRYTVSVWGKNLANEAVLTQLTASTLATGAQYQPPRTYGATMGFHF